MCVSVSVSVSMRVYVRLLRSAYINASNHRYPPKMIPISSAPQYNLTIDNVLLLKGLTVCTQPVWPDLV